MTHTMDKHDTFPANLAKLGSFVAVFTLNAIFALPAVALLAAPFVACYSF